MYYESNVIYGETKNNGSFEWNGFTYYMTKTGIAKKRKFNEKPIKITMDEFNKVCKEYSSVFR